MTAIPSSGEHLDAPVPTRADDPAPFIARAGWGPIAVICVILVTFVVLGMVVFGPRSWPSVVIAVPVILWAFWFFRDPQRAIPQAPGVVVSAADGLVMRVEPCAPPEELGIPASSAAGMTRIVVFLNVFNVHVNRVPIGGRIVKVERKGGLFAHAGKPASELNARNSVAIELPDGRYAVVVQITGLIARRIICDLKGGETLPTGRRFGLIRFGSRTDVYLPAGARVTVAPGQKVKGGSTIVAWV